MLKSLKLLLLVLTMSLLSACLGGTVAQQIARSIATSIADKGVANAMDVDEYAEPKKRQSRTLQNIVPNDRWVALTTAKFSPANTTLPEANTNAEPEETQLAIARTNQFVQVELHNLLITDEKNVLFEKARLIGSLNLPQQREWALWHVATGSLSGKDELITFLIPPHFGKLPSGSVAIVEIAPAGDLNIARYTVN